MKYTYRKSDGEDIWTVGHDDNGKWIPESDWKSELYAAIRTAFLNGEQLPFRQIESILSVRQKVEEMHEGYRKEQNRRMGDNHNHHYHRGAADACGLILDLAELRLFLPAKDGGE